MPLINNYKKAYNKLRIKYKSLYYQLRDLNRGIKARNIRIKKFTKSHIRVLGMCQKINRTSTSKFINLYHKRPIITSNRLAYLAGLIDGEGYFKVEKQGTLRLKIGMCDKKTIKWIKKHFGGTIRLQKTPKGRPFFVWTINQGKELFYLLLYLIPFLVNKKKIAIKFFEIIVNKFKKLEHTIKQVKL